MQIVGSKVGEEAHCCTHGKGEDSTGYTQSGINAFIDRPGETKGSVLPVGQPDPGMGQQRVVELPVMLLTST